MSSTAIALLSAGCMFGGTLLGVWLQLRLPTHHLDDDAHETVKLAAGMIGTITALVLGLLVSSSKSTFDSLNDGLKQGSAKLILLDRILAQYGPGAQSVRFELKQAVVAGLKAPRVKRPDPGSDLPAAPFTNRMEAVQCLLRELPPQTDPQRQLLAQAQQVAADLAQTRWLMMEEEQNELPVPLLGIMIFWLTVLFVSFGLFSPRNGTVLSVLFLCACSVAAAVFLVLELNRPLDGFIKLSTAPVRSLMQQLGR